MSAVTEADIERFLKIFGKNVRGPLPERDDVTIAAVRAGLTADRDAVANRKGWPEREERVDAILKEYAKYISDRPMLTSLLYDIDMLPEQCVTVAGAVRLAGLCEVWKKYEEARDAGKEASK